MSPMFRRLFDALRKPPKWLLVVLGLLLAAVLIWFVGPLVSVARVTPLASPWVRLVLILLLWGGFAAFHAGRAWAARRRNGEMVKALADTPSAPAAATPGLAAADVQAMEERAAKALGLLREARVGKNREYVYELPWYVIIGPPGAGKTTALKNSGLHFPMAEAMGEGPVKGLGGTRTTDWWITDQAVLIDTAGRYTTQDSEKAVDAEAWTGFLQLLKRHRPRQPLTGVLVAISMTDLAGADESAALAHGRAVRQRINEVQQTFGVRVPVYVLVTKMDLLAGFVEFFDDLGQAEREQVWGETLALDLSKPDAAATAGAAFEPAFDALVERLNARLLSRMQSETDMQRRGLMFGFPQQFASLRAPLAALLQTIGQETRFEPTPLLRGFYFTSGVQLGRPIDRLLGAVSQRFGLPVTPMGREGARGRAYFLRELLRGVIFPEAALAGRDPRAERRRRLVATAVVGAGAAAAVLLSAAWLVSYARTASLLHKLHDRSETLARDTTALPGGQVSDSDLLAVLPVLEEGRALPFASTAAPAERGAGFGFGVGRDHALRAQVDAAYRNLLNRQLLPRLVLQLEDQLRTLTAAVPAADDKGPDPRPAIYTTLRTYLMLGRAPAAPLEKGAISASFADDWADRFPGQDQEPARQALGRHLDALLAGPLQPPRLDADLIAAARARVATLGPGERVYSRLTADAGLRDLAPFALTDAPGVANAHLFVRRSGKPLAAPSVPGMFRHASFYTAVLPAIAKAASQSADEGWVMGEAPRDRGPLDGEAGRIKDALLVAYLKDFTTRWDDLIGDVAVSGDLPVAERIQQAVRPPSPVKSLYETLAAETDLTPPSAKGGVGSAFRVGALFSRTIYRGVQRAGQVGSAARTTPSGPPGPLDEVIEHFRWLRDLNPATGPAPMDDALQALGAVGDANASAKSASGLGDPVLQHEHAASAMAATAKLSQVSATLPAGAGALFSGFVKASTTQLNHDVGESVKAAYAGQAGPECKSILAQGYPFSPAAEHQASVDDFSRLFRPTGLLDQFQTQSLNGQIDTTRSPWTLTASGRALNLQPAAVRQLEAADHIRRAFFKPGDVRPNVRFVVEPLKIDGDATAVTLTVDGAPAAFDRTNRKPVELRWPGSQPGVSVSFQHAGSAAPAVRTWPGDWGLQRMIRDSRPSQVRAGGLVFEVTEGGASASFRLRLLNTATNPFALPELAKFQCPASL